MVLQDGFGFENVTLEGILGYVFAPLAFLIGVPWDEAVRAGSFIGQKLILNEFVAFSNFGPVIGDYRTKQPSLSRSLFVVLQT